MKKFTPTITTMAMPATTSAQTRKKMSYQEVVRNSNNELLRNRQVGMQVSILQGSKDGTAVYTETQTPTSNANGLVSIEIGGGTAISGDFSTIDWAGGPYFIKTETDTEGGTNYTGTVTSRLLSVPYALHANTANSLTVSPGVSWENASQSEFGDATTVLKQIEFTAPDAGYIVVTFSGFINTEPKDTIKQMWLTLELNKESNYISSRPDVELSDTRFDIRHTYYRYPFHITKAFAVSKGENILYLNGRKRHINGKAWLRANPVVMYFPVRYQTPEQE